MTVRDLNFNGASPNSTQTLLVVSVELPQFLSGASLCPAPADLQFGQRSSQRSLAAPSITALGIGLFCVCFFAPPSE